MDSIVRAYVINLDERPDRMVEFNKNQFPFPVERISGVKSENGAIGCTLSHFNLLKTQQEFPFVVFEDDCVMLQPWSFVEEAMKQLSSDWDALWLGATLDTPLVRYSENLFRLKRGYCTHAIIYNSRELIDYTLTHYATVDHKRIIDIFYYQFVQEKFNCFITYPITTKQLGGLSNVMGREWTGEDDKWIQQCYDKFMR